MEEPGIGTPMGLKGFNYLNIFSPKNNKIFILEKKRPFKELKRQLVLIGNLKNSKMEMH